MKYRRQSRSCRLGLLLIAALCSTATAFAQNQQKGPPTEPILRLNTTMHSTILNRIDIDSGGRYLVTASNDKTAKLWDARTGEFLRSFRVPIGGEEEGQIRSCAISPDGRFLLVGGWTGYEWSGSDSVYVFDVASGGLIRRISGFRAIVNNLGFSRDGRYAAACLGVGEGVSIISAADWTVLKTLSGYGETSYRCSFAADGRLATVCNDGKLRLYDAAFNLIRQVDATAGKLPFSVAFSPDGSMLAVGYIDSPKVQVLDAATLAVLYEPATQDLDAKSNLGAVAWSPDGKYLYGGGTASIRSAGSWWSIIRQYAEGGRGPFIDIPACADIVMDLRPVSDGLIFGGAQPVLGKFDLAGGRVYYSQAEICNFSAKDERHLKIGAADAGVIGFTPFNKAAMTFSIDSKSLVQGESAGGSYVDAKNGSVISDWENSTQPKLNGKALSFLEKYERNISATIADNGNLVFGADWNLYCLDSSGSTLWKVPAPGTTWAANSAGNKIVAAFSDGTIRWYRLSDGKELLSLFVDPDLKRWVLWSPSGYYDCSPGGQDLIGWHVNNGPDAAADFFPAGRFAGRFYRPDVVKNTIVYGDEAIALAEADKAKGIRASGKSIAESLPPVITILSPDSGTTVQNASTELAVAVKTPESDPVTEIKVLVNGRPSGAAVRGLSIVPKAGQADQRRLPVTLSEGDNEVSVLAKNASGYSEAAKVRIRYSAAAATPEFLIKPALYVLAVGVSKYEESDISLKYPAKDAHDFAAVMTKQKGGLYREVTVKTLTDEAATKDGILDGLDWIQSETTSKDLAVIFIAGHGMNDNTGNLYYLAYDTSPDRLKRTGLPADEVTKTVAAISGKVLYFMDTCHSGNLRTTTSRAVGGIDFTGVINELTSAENGAVVFCSSSAKQYALESDSWGNGAFTKALVEGLSGEADYMKNGKITINELDLYVSERVKALTGGKQTPVTSKPDTIRDFPIALK